MILSYHPCITADENMTCAGRDPDVKDLACIQAAAAVVLPQGCGRLLYEMARQHCPHVFPDYDARFAFPDKISQIRLFKKTAILFPETEAFLNFDAFVRRYGHRPIRVCFDYPLMFKFNWGGEGETVYLIRSGRELANALQNAQEYEKTGQSGFLLQKYIPSKNRSLRVVVIGQKFWSYWRIQKNENDFFSSVAKGADIDKIIEMDLQEKGIEAVKTICKKTGINLAGFDLLFSSKKETGTDTTGPFLLEVNYFFGRKGLGGSDNYYAMVNEAVLKWIKQLDLSKGHETAIAAEKNRQGFGQGAT